LDPNERHGQKATFLKLLIKQFELRVVPLKLLDDLKNIVVTLQDPTDETARNHLARIWPHFHLYKKP
jgi:hypothetical protein